jgi:MmyB-like transcription regulator ligand binding domain
VGASAGSPVYPEWEKLARAVVSYLRMEAARKPDDPRLAELVGDLSIRDAQFRQWWAGTHVDIVRAQADVSDSLGLRTPTLLRRCSRREPASAT